MRSRIWRNGSILVGLNVTCGAEGKAIVGGTLSTVNRGSGIDYVESVIIILTRMQGFHFTSQALDTGMGVTRSGGILERFRSRDNKVAV